MSSVTFSHTTGSVSSTPSNQTSLDTLARCAPPTNGCEVWSEISTIAELWAIHPSSTILPRTVHELLAVYDTFTRVERVYLHAMEMLNEFPIQLSEDRYDILHELEIRSSADLVALWDVVTRIATVSMLAPILFATPTQDP